MKKAKIKPATPTILDVLKIAQRELSEFYTPKQSQALSELGDKIKELETETLIHVLTIDKKVVSKSLLDKLQEYELYEYMDVALEEHLYSCDKDHILDKAADKNVRFTQKELKELDKLCFENQEAAYFRIVNNL